MGVQVAFLSYRRNVWVMSLKRSKFLRLIHNQQWDLLPGLATPGPVALHGFHSIHALLPCPRPLACHPTTQLAVQMENWELLVWGDRDNHYTTETDGNCLCSKQLGAAFTVDKAPIIVAFWLKFSSDFYP